MGRHHPERGRFLGRSRTARGRQRPQTPPAPGGEAKTGGVVATAARKRAGPPSLLRWPQSCGVAPNAAHGARAVPPRQALSAGVPDAVGAGHLSPTRRAKLASGAVEEAPVEMRHWTRRATTPTPAREAGRGRSGMMGSDGPRREFSADTGSAARRRCASQSGTGLGGTARWNAHVSTSGSREAQGRRCGALTTK